MIFKNRKNEIIKNFDGKLWICTERLKTKTKVKVPLLDTPIKLYEKYKNLTDKQNKVIFGGRLGEYKYYDMDKTIEVVLDMCQLELY